MNKILITGAKGFIGKNLAVALRRAGVEVAEVDVDSPAGALNAGVRGATVVFHLAGVNRPPCEGDFQTGNVGSIEGLITVITENSAAAPGRPRPLIVLSSSAQAGCDNPYGRSKLTAEQALETYAFRTGNPVMIYRLPGVFGKWCRPNYNSVVATFCHNIARDLPIAVSDPGRTIQLVHVDDVVTEFMRHIGKSYEGVERGEVQPTFTISLGDLSEKIRAFRAMRQTLLVADASDPFTRRLLGTYTSYLPSSELAYPLAQRSDARGTLAELLKSPQFGQIFVSRTLPGVTRGNHYHDLKVEKFCVLDGDAVIRFRPILGSEIAEYCVSGRAFKVVDIPPGVTHSIENIGTTELITLFWASEPFDPERPDTFFESVEQGAGDR
jgi:UDP-2-acetamido-2,6-beta-L-arabino-hexul-4-ose reductase